MKKQIEALAKRIFKDFLVSPERLKNKFWHNMNVREWSDLKVYNQDNFRFIARWYLEHKSGAAKSGVVAK